MIIFLAILANSAIKNYKIFKFEIINKLRKKLIKCGIFYYFIDKFFNLNNTNTPLTRYLLIGIVIH